MSKTKKLFSKSDLRIILSSFFNLVFKIVMVYLIIDVYKYDPKKSYYVVLIVVLTASFFSNLKIGFGKKFKLKFLVKWLFVMILLLVVENYLFLFFQELYEIKVVLSLILSLFLYLLRFFLQKLFIFS